MSDKDKLLQNRLDDIASTYGALNEIGISDHNPTANRRSLTTTNAISEVIATHFTPDVLANKTEFLGVVLASIPSTQPKLSSKSQQFETFSSTFRQEGSKTLFFTYKVLIPEIETRCIILNKKRAKRAGGLSIAQRINSMADVGLDVTLYNASEAVRAIEPGTLVKVTYEDLGRMKGPKIVAVYKKVFNFSPTGTAKSSVDKFRTGDIELPGELVDDTTGDIELPGELEDIPEDTGLPAWWPEYTGSAPVADQLAKDVTALGTVTVKKYSYRAQNEMRNGGDIDQGVADAALKLFTELSSSHPELNFKISAGNDEYHHGLVCHKGKKASGKSGRCYSSRHIQGNALDFVFTKGSYSADKKKVLDVLDRLVAGNEGEFGYIDEYAKKSSSATGKHFHFSWGGETGDLVVNWAETEKDKKVRDAEDAIEKKITV